MQVMNDFELHRLCTQFNVSTIGAKQKQTLGFPKTSSNPRQMLGVCGSFEKEPLHFFEPVPKGSCFSRLFRHFVSSGEVQSFQSIRRFKLVDEDLVSSGKMLHLDKLLPGMKENVSDHECQLVCFELRFKSSEIRQSTTKDFCF